MPEARARVDRFGEQIIDGRFRFGPHENLVSEQSFAVPDQRFVSAEEKAGKPVITDGFRERRRDAPLFENLVARLIEQFSERAEREQARMSRVQNSFFAIVELTEKQHQARYP